MRPLSEEGMIGFLRWAGRTVGRRSANSLSRAGLLSWAGAAFWGAMVGLRARQALDGDWIAGPLALQAGLAAYRLLEREPARSESPIGWRLIAWGAALLPFALRPGGEELMPETIAAIITLAGLALSLWALVSLGRSFGIAPADRGLVVRGAYRVLRHPMYAGEVFSYLGYLAAHGRAWNLALLGIVLLSALLRILEEEARLAGYPPYAARVRWRLLPGVW